MVVMCVFENGAFICVIVCVCVCVHVCLCVCVRMCVRTCVLRLRGLSIFQGFTVVAMLRMRSLRVGLGLQERREHYRGCGWGVLIAVGLSPPTQQFYDCIREGGLCGAILLLVWFEGTDVSLGCRVWAVVAAWRKLPFFPQVCLTNDVCMVFMWPYMCTCIHAHSWDILLRKLCARVTHDGAWLVS